MSVLSSQSIEFIVLMADKLPLLSLICICLLASCFIVLHSDLKVICFNIRPVICLHGVTYLAIFGYLNAILAWTYDRAPASMNINWLTSLLIILLWLYGDFLMLLNGGLPSSGVLISC